MKHVVLTISQSVLALFVALCPGFAQACSVCFGDPNSQMAKGVNAGVLVLLGVVGVVLTLFAILIGYFWWRGKQVNQSH